MKHHRLSRPFFPCLLLIICGLSAWSPAQLPPSVIAAPAQAPIDQFVKTQVAQLLSSSTSSWTSARNLLIAEGSHRGAAPTFSGLYSASINANLIPLATNSDARIRLNAAVVAARVAAKVDTSATALAPLTEAFLKDNSDPVVLWGLQTAKYVVPNLLASGVPGDVKIADIIAKAAVEATKNHMTPAVVEEAYRVLLLDPLLPGQSPTNYFNIIAAKDLQAFLANSLAIYEFRIKLYGGDEPPKQPLADTWASTFFTSDKVWAAANAAQRDQALNLMLALLKGASKQNDASTNPEMLDVIKRTGQAIEVIANRLKNTALYSAAHAVTLTTATSTSGDIDTAIETLATAVSTAGFLPAP